jgi:hypothetical protein
MKDFSYDDVFIDFCTANHIDVTKLDNIEKEKLQATTSYHLYLVSSKLKWIAKNFGVHLSRNTNEK